MNQYTVLRQFTDPVQGIRPVGSIATLEAGRGAKLAKMGYVSLLDEDVKYLIRMRYVNEGLEFYNHLTGATIARISAAGISAIINGTIIANLTGNVTGNLTGNVTGNADTATVAQRIGTGTPVNAVASTLTTALAGADNDMVFTAKTKGVAGDGITIEYVDPAADHVLSVGVVGTVITVTLGYALGAITSSAADIKTIVDGTPAAAALVSVANAGADTGAGLVTALVATPLSGGVDGTVGDAGDILFDASYIYQCIAANTIADANWRRITLGAVF